MRSDLIGIQQRHTWRKPEEIQAEIVKINAMEEQEVRDSHEEYDREESFGYHCPLCQLTDATDYDIARYFMFCHGFKTTKEVAVFFKSTFGTYDKLKDFINPPKKV